MKTKVGFIKLSRNILGWKLFRDIKATYVFLHLLLHAPYTKTKQCGIELNPGQLFITGKQLATNTGLSMQEIRTALKKLVQAGTITKETTTKATTNKSLITICNWKVYQTALSWEERKKQHRSQPKEGSPYNKYIYNKKNKEDKERDEDFFKGLSNSNSKFKNYDK